MTLTADSFTDEHPVATATATNTPPPPGWQLTPDGWRVAAAARRAKVALRPPKLLQRMEAYGIELPPAQPVYDRVLVYPLDQRDQPDQTSGGIIVPDQAKQRAGAQRGLLVMAGPRAIEHLYSHGIEIGDIVWCARLSPWERPYFSATRRWHRALVIRSSEIVGSEDLDRALESGALWFEMDAEGRVQINGRERVDPPENDEGT